MATRKTDPTPETTPTPEEVEITIGGEFAGLLGDVARERVAWIPRETGAVIAGRVVTTEQVTSEFGPIPVLVLDTNPADPTAPYVRWAWMGVVLEKAWKRHDPTRGDRVAGRYLGKRDTGRPRRDGGEGNETYDDWQVLVIKPTGDDETPAYKPGSAAGAARAVARTLAGDTPAVAPVAEAPPVDPSEEPF